MEVVYDNSEEETDLFALQDSSLKVHTKQFWHETFWVYTMVKRTSIKSQNDRGIFKKYIGIWKCLN